MDEAGRLLNSRASMREVADLAGVAMSSVSRVLSGHPDVSPSMRRRVIAAAEQLRYQPNFLAQSLRRRATQTVGFIVGDIANPLLAEVVKGAVTQLRQAGYSLLLTDSEGDPDLDAHHIRVFSRRQVDGLILSLSLEDYPESVSALATFPGPIVAIDRDLPLGIRADRVLSDHRRGMKTAIHRLLDLGHRRIGFISGQRVRPTRERRAALEQAFSERELPPTFTVEHASSGRASESARACRALLDAHDPPTAVVAAGNQLMLGALEELHRRGITVGAELSFVGCDEIAIAALHEPPIAIIRRDNAELGTLAASLLLRRIKMRSEQEEDGDPPKDEPSVDHVLPTEFVPTPSCAPPPV
jgi:LacI family transcriptional regulator